MNITNQLIREYITANTPETIKEIACQHSGVDGSSVAVMLTAKEIIERITLLIISKEFAEGKPTTLTIDQAWEIEQIIESYHRGDGVVTSSKTVEQLKLITPGKLARALVFGYVVEDKVG